GGPRASTYRTHDAPQGTAVRGAPVLRDCTLPLQLSARAPGALPGRHAEPPDQRRRLQRAREGRLPAQRHLHVPAALRRMPRLRAGARAGGRFPANPQPAARSEGASRTADAGRAARFLSRALRPVPALPVESPRRRRHGPRQPRAVRAVPAAEQGQHAPGRVPRGRRHAAHGVDHRHPQRRPVVGVHVLRSRLTRRELRHVERPLADRAVPPAEPAAPVSRLLDRTEPEDGLQGQLQADRVPRRRPLDAVPRGRVRRRAMNPYAFARPFLFALDPEHAHELTLGAIDRAARLGALQLAAGCPVDDPIEVMGLRFRNRVGLAAGLDKDAAHIDALAAMGFGFIEVGTVTPKPQPGNPRPRMFRLPQRDALINRMGFNNAGIDAFVANVRRAKWRGVLGLNIGKNAATPIERALDDYLFCLDGVYEHASYVTVNVSSPNTKNLRQLQRGDALDELLAGLQARRGELATRHGRRVPLALKIAPDLDDEQ